MSVNNQKDVIKIFKGQFKRFTVSLFNPVTKVYEDLTGLTTSNIVVYLLKADGTKLAITGNTSGAGTTGLAIASATAGKITVNISASDTALLAQTVDGLLEIEWTKAGEEYVTQDDVLYVLPRL